jgi:hypothetical protein
MREVTGWALLVDAWGELEQLYFDDLSGSAQAGQFDVQ